LRTRELVERISGIVVLALLVAWLIWNFASNSHIFMQSTVYGLSNGVLYALVALGYTMVYGIIELINFAHGDLFMLGTLFAAYTMHSLGFDTPSAGAWLGFLLLLLVAMVFCGTINVTIEFLAYRRLRKAPKLAPLITAVGMSFILQWVGLRWNGSSPKSWNSMLPQGALDIGGVKIAYKSMIVALITAILLTIMGWVVAKTRAGKAMRATAQDQDAARLMGINVNRTISFTFALGGALAGAAGMLYLEAIGTTRYDAGFRLGLYAFTAAVLGGIGNLYGAVLGGLLIGLIQAYNDGFPHALGQKWSQTVVFSVLILLMVFRPTGILGKPTGERA
jgi:branched-chain amino acid transport system permease protein